MAASITLTGFEEAISSLTDFERDQLPFALAKTLNDIAAIAKDKAYQEMRHVFSQPTPFTLNSLTIERAKKNKLEARLRLKDPTRIDDPHHYLNVELNGGERGYKPFEARLWRKGVLPGGEFAIPASGASFDAYGNMNRGQITQILSSFDAFGDAGFKANMGIEGRKRLNKGTKKRHGFAYFSVKPGTGNHLNPGIYKRTNMNSGALAGPAQSIVPVMIFSEVARYEPRINLQRIVNETYAADVRNVFEQNLEAAMRSARWATG